MHRGIKAAPSGRPASLFAKEAKSTVGWKCSCKPRCTTSTLRRTSSCKIERFCQYTLAWTRKVNFHRDSEFNDFSNWGAIPEPAICWLADSVKPTDFLNYGMGFWDVCSAYTYKVYSHPSHKMMWLNCFHQCSGIDLVSTGEQHNFMSSRELSDFPRVSNNRINCLHEKL